MFHIWKLRRCTNAFNCFVRFYPLFTTLKNVTWKLRRISFDRSSSMKIATFSAVYGMAVLPSLKSNLDELLKEADSLFEEKKYAEIIKVLEPLKNIKNEEVFWRLGRALYTLAKDVTDEKKKKEMIFEANDFIKQSLSINENNYNVHKWMAIIMDATSAYNGIKEKITQAHIMKQHMLRALELNPKDATVFYLLGSWCFEVASMLWYQRKIASTIFATPPTSSFEEALHFFIKAEEVDPHFYSMNFLMLGKTYLKMNNSEKAAYYLKLARDYPQKTSDDIKAKNEAISLLKQL